MTAESYPCTPEEFWADDETSRLGHTGADLSHPDGRNPLEPTNAYIRRLVTERNGALAKVARAEALADEWEAGSPSWGATWNGTPVEWWRELHAALADPAPVEQQVGEACADTPDAQEAPGPLRRCIEKRDYLPCQKRKDHAGGHWFMSDDQWQCLDAGHFDPSDLLAMKPLRHLNVPCSRKAGR